MVAPSKFLEEQLPQRIREFSPRRRGLCGSCNQVP